MKGSNIVGRQSASLLRYLRVLVREYPTPVRATQLAVLSGVTKASITKMHDRIIDLCDTKVAATTRAFLLRSDNDTFAKTFLIFSLAGIHREFLRSHYFARVISEERVHALLSTAIPNYDQYFGLGDTSFVITRFLDFLVKLDPSIMVEVLKSVLVDSSHAIPIQLISEIEDIAPSIFKVKNEREFSALMRVRDATFFLIRDFLWTKIENLSIVKSKNSKERASYSSVYKETVDYYLRSYVESMDGIISKAFKRENRLRWKIPPIGTVLLELNNGKKSS